MGEILHLAKHGLAAKMASLYNYGWFPPPPSLLFIVMREWDLLHDNSSITDPPSLQVHFVELVRSACLPFLALAGTPVDGLCASHGPFDLSRTLSGHHTLNTSTCPTLSLTRSKSPWTSVQSFIRTTLSKLT